MQKGTEHVLSDTHIHFSQFLAMTTCLKLLTLGLSCSDLPGIIISDFKELFSSLHFFFVKIFLFSKRNEMRTTYLWKQFFKSHPYIEDDMDIHIQEVLRIPNVFHQKSTSPHREYKERRNIESNERDILSQ